MCLFWEMMSLDELYVNGVHILPHKNIMCTFIFQKLIIVNYYTKHVTVETSIVQLCRELWRKSDCWTVSFLLSSSLAHHLPPPLTGPSCQLT